jgi:hypothetical protein
VSRALLVTEEEKNEITTDIRTGSDLCDYHHTVAFDGGQYIRGRKGSRLFYAFLTPGI